MCNKLNFELFLQLINDYTTPPEKVFCRGLESEIQQSVEFLQNCRPFAVSMTNALKYIKVLISQENSNDGDDDVSDGNSMKSLIVIKILSNRKSNV
jgi:translation initiation factor 2B subunit (eIF-2B alpha/beta/delta family)